MRPNAGSRPCSPTIAERPTIAPARVVAIFAIVLAAWACSPELDWREIRSEEGGFVAILPGKPRFEERALTGRPGMVMHLWSARAGAAVFGVGYVDAPSVTPALVAGTRDALAANIDGRIVDDRDVAVGPARGREFRAEGPSATLIARVVVVDHRLYQVALIGKKGALDASGVEMFFSSFKLLPAK